MTKPRPTNRKHDRCEISLANLAAMHKTGLIRSPFLRGLWYRGLIRTSDGRHADKAQAMLSNILAGPMAAAAFMPPKPPRLPVVAADTAILLGYEVGSHPARPVQIDRDTLVLHTLLLGESGMGKSYLMMSIIAQINRQNHRIVENA